MTGDSTSPGDASTTQATPQASAPRATEHDAALRWLDELAPATTPAAVVAQEVRDVATAVDRVQVAEEDLTAAVLPARRAGASWNHLALALGVSRQAARQRFAALEKFSTPVY
ncbi:hypothetical protein [Kineococcus rubinsiae]|uniref:hypothetical protein n=1 Tax=Kineococcus rubinsiae TaxID=2609562 RepID=UPI001430CBB2|nr:hypothetical protein [Kineococcus rubinsiae]NIZ93392.1 hypothetical protein [Kineococcus rubinsiae]